CEALGHARARLLLGVNATALPFNSLAAIEKSADGRTNPMVNSGAIAATSLVPGATAAEQWHAIRSGLSPFAGRGLALGEDIYACGSEPHHRNRAVARLLQSLDASISIRSRRSSSTRGSRRSG